MAGRGVNGNEGQDMNSGDVPKPDFQKGKTMEYSSVMYNGITSRLTHVQRENFYLQKQRSQ